MKTTLVLTGIVASVVSLPAGGRAESTPQAYFEVTVSKDGKLVGKPHALVRVGADANLTFAGEDAAAPRLGLRYRVEQRDASVLAATVTALVGGKPVSTFTLPFTREQAGAGSFAGGGYTWHVAARFATPELLARSAASESRNAFLGCGKVPGGKPVVKMVFKPVVPLRDLIGFMSTISCTGFLITDDVAIDRTVKLHAPTLVTSDQAYDVLTAALRSSGLALQPTGKLLRIVQAPPPN
jgi:hypothetical protein